jgi:hypothetical protein
MSFGGNEVTPNNVADFRNFLLGVQSQQTSASNVLHKKQESGKPCHKGEINRTSTCEENV